MTSTPIHVAIVPVAPGEAGFVHVVGLDDFDAAPTQVVDLGALVAWRYETYCDSGRTYTRRLPVGEAGDVTGADWEPADVLPDLDTHRAFITATQRGIALAEIARMTTTIEEN